MDFARLKAMAKTQAQRAKQCKARLDALKRRGMVPLFAVGWATRAYQSTNDDKATVLVMVPWILMWWLDFRKRRKREREQMPYFSAFQQWERRARHWRWWRSIKRASWRPNPTASQVLSHSDVASFFHQRRAQELRTLHPT